MSDMSVAARVRLTPPQCTAGETVRGATPNLSSAIAVAPTAPMMRPPKAVWRSRASAAAMMLATFPKQCARHPEQTTQNISNHPLRESHPEAPRQWHDATPKRRHPNTCTRAASGWSATAQQFRETVARMRVRGRRSLSMACVRWKELQTCDSAQSGGAQTQRESHKENMKIASVVLTMSPTWVPLRAPPA